MNDRNNENLREILAKFMGADEVSQVINDIERGDELLGKFPAPAPRDSIIEGIKIQMAAAARRRHRETIQLGFLKALSVAAAIVTISIAAHKYFERTPTEQARVTYAAVIPDRLWEGSDITTDDAGIAVIAAEITTIENQLNGIELRDIDISGSGTADDLEMELIGISGDFWKG